MKNTLLFYLCVVFVNIVFVFSNLEKRDVHHKIIIKTSRPVRSHKTSSHHHKEHGRTKHKEHHPRNYHQHYRDYYRHSDEFEDNDSAYDEPRYYKRPHHSYYSSEEYEMKPSIELSKNQGRWGAPLGEIDLPQSSTSHSNKRYRTPSSRFKNSLPSKKLPLFDEDYNFSHEFNYQNKQAARRYKNKNFYRLQKDLFGNNTYEVLEPPRETSQTHPARDFQALAPSFEMSQTDYATQLQRELDAKDTLNMKNPLNFYSSERKLNRKKFKSI